MDTLTPTKRSALMARVRTRDTRPEMVVRKVVHGLGYRYILHDRRLPGTPDVAFPARKKAVMVHGCFWHGHSCRRGSLPKANQDFWVAKINGNRRRDALKTNSLEAMGWQVLTIWECETSATALDQL
ncbi:MAG: very short patch repair endonuclease [Pseudomonadota bacterium]